MEQTRRIFGKLLVAAWIATMLPFATSCGTSLQGLVGVVIDAVTAILKVAAPAASWVGPLTSALAALKTAMASWTNGGAVQLIVDAIDTIQAVLAAIPFKAVYSPLIALLVAGITAVLDYIGPVATAVVLRDHISGNPYAGKAVLKKPHLFQTEQGAFRAQWNATAVQISLPAAKI